MNWIAKGQLISKCRFGVFKSPKKPMKFFPESLPSLKGGQIKKGHLIPLLGKIFVGFLGDLKTPKGHFELPDL